ncbi:hypothetical protein [uncultured Microbacterium sp.]|uniref:hypothetical protein n=1 Tax=uncultured Microbacterium sp. TaxID=191216 RepID=UPI0025F756BE|nr:hypothetical protein [uncultured Microbacterium sp.]
MPIFGALSAGDAARLIHDNRRLATENADLKRAAEAAGLRADRAEADLRAAADAAPVEFASVLAALKARVPSLPYAPGYLLASKASTADDFAQALHVMLLHAQTVGRAEGAAR